MRLPHRDELAAMLRLAIPVVTAQLGIMLMGVVDTLMVGRVSAEALASVALGNLYFIVTIVISSGTLMVLDPVVAQAIGAGDREGAARGIQRGVLLSVVLSVASALALWPVRSVLALLHQPPVLIPVASQYVLISILGVIPFLAFIVLRQSLQAIGATGMIVAVIIVANVLNATLNWVFVYGHAGSPALGAVGSAWATLVGRWFMGVALLLCGWRKLRPYLLPVRREIFHGAPMRTMLRLGLPVGFHQFVELAVFAAIGVLMGVLGTRELASHQIAINLASLTFMVPLGVGAAAAVRVGYAAGAGNGGAARESAAAALLCGTGFMVLSGVILIAVPELLARTYTNDAGVIALTASLIPIAGVFQVFDGINAVCAGILRGLGDTRAAFLINIAGFWLVGFPISILLGFHTSLRGRGLWWGLVAGLAIVALLLLIRVRQRLRRPIARTHIDAEIAHGALDP